MSSNLRLISDTIDTCSKETGVDIAGYPFATKLQGVGTPGQVLQVYQVRAQEIENYLGKDQILVDQLLPIVHTLYSLNEVLGEAVSLEPFLVTRAILVVVDVLLTVTSGLSSGCNALAELFGSLEVILRRTPNFTKPTITASISNVALKILLEVLSLLSVATRQTKQGELKRFANKWLGTGNLKVEAVLQRLDRLTEEDTCVVAVQTLEVVHCLVNNIKVVTDGGEPSMSTIRQNLIIIRRALFKPGAHLRETSRNWLSFSDPSRKHVILCDNFHEGSAEWFIQGSMFEKWNAMGSLLWIHGKPGSGKSMLSSAIIQEVITLNETGLCLGSFFYFDSKDQNKQSLRSFLVSTLIHLLHQSDSCYKVFQDLYIAHGFGSKLPTNKVLAQCLKDMLMLPRHPTVYLIIDALDECPIDSNDGSLREKTLDFIEDLVGLHLPNLRICITSRLEADIEFVLKPLASFSISLHDEEGQNQSIVDFIKFVVQVQSTREMQKWSMDIKTQVIDTLSKRADGRFRWVSSKLGALSRLLLMDIPLALERL